MLTARRLATPLSELAIAAEHLSASGEAPLLTPKGLRELRITIAAFNRLQERLRRFNDDRVQMLAAMSHDLRTSLTRVKLRLELGESPEQRQKMIHELDAMGTMIGSISPSRATIRSVSRASSSISMPWCKASARMLATPVGR